MTSVLGTVGFVDPEAQASSATSAGRTLSALRASRNFRESAGSTLYVAKYLAPPAGVVLTYADPLLAPAMLGPASAAICVLCVQAAQPIDAVQVVP